MAKLNLNPNTPEEQIILNHLTSQINDELAEKINNGIRIQKDGKTLISKKTLKTFMTYAEEEVLKLIAENERKGRQVRCINASTVYGWAIHYFEEDSIEGKLYNEDGTEYQPPKPVTKPKPATPAVPYSTTKPTPKPQLTIFEMLPDNSQTKSETTIIKATAEQPQTEQQKSSPIYQHYLSVKKKYNDCIVFYRLGDFYEMFDNDAVTTAKELDLTLTGRDFGLDERVPMTGIPFHAAEAYIAKLVKKNYKVVICEQLENNTIERVITKQPEDNRLVDVETGEILSDNVEELSVEEMRQFDGDISEHADLPTVSKLLGNEQPDVDDFDIEKERQAAKAFDLEAMIILQELLDNKITLI